MSDGCIGTPVSVVWNRHAGSNNNERKMKMSATMWHIFPCLLESSPELSAGKTNIFTHFPLFSFFCVYSVRWLNNESQWPCKLYAFLFLTTLLTDNYIAIVEFMLCRSASQRRIDIFRVVADLSTIIIIVRVDSIIYRLRTDMFRSFSVLCSVTSPLSTTEQAQESKSRKKSSRHDEVQWRNSLVCVIWRVTCMSMIITNTSSAYIFSHINYVLAHQHFKRTPTWHRPKQTKEKSTIRQNILFSFIRSLTTGTMSVCCILFLDCVPAMCGSEFKE